METTTELPTMTATRTWNKTGTKATITVRIEDPQNPARSFVSDLGGQRAARATAAIITQWPHKAEPGCYGLRADMDKAQSEAASLKRTRMKTHGVWIECTGATWAVAIPVTDAQA